MRNAHPCCRAGDHGAIGKGHGVTIDHLGHQCNALSCGEVRQTHDAGVWLISVEYEQSEVVVDGDQHPLLADRLPQQGLIAGIRDDLGCLAHIVALSAQPQGKPASGATVDEKSHPDTATRSMRSLAMTAWA